MIDVTAPPSPYMGIDPTGVNDIHTRLQQMLNGMVGTTPGPRGALYFPPGRYRLGSTLVFPAQTGQHIFGCGMGQRDAEGTSASGISSVIFWSGADGDPMIEYYGEGLVWNGVDLWGDKHLSESSSSSGESRAGTAFLIKRPSSSSPLQAGKIWFSSLRVEFCETAVATASNSVGAADEVAFGYFWAEDCDIALHLNHATSMPYVFEYVHAVNCGTVFKVSEGGRIFTQSIRIPTSNTTVLELLGGDATNAFYQINGLAVDDGVNGTVLLNNDDSGDGTQHVRFTNAHLICSDTSDCPPESSSSSSASPEVSTNCHAVTAVIDRTGGNGGQTMLELVGCRGLSALNDNITIMGDSVSKKSYLIVRESETREAGFLIDKAGSSHYKYNGIENWTYPCGIVPDDSSSG